MGLKVKSTTNYDLGTNLTNFFSMPIDELTIKEENYDDLKAKIYNLDLDVEDKADILNAISRFKSTNSQKEKNKLKQQIELFIKEYDLK